MLMMCCDDDDDDDDVDDNDDFRQRVWCSGDQGRGDYSVALCQFQRRLGGGADAAQGRLLGGCPDKVGLLTRGELHEHVCPPPPPHHEYY